MDAQNKNRDHEEDVEDVDPGLGPDDVIHNSCLSFRHTEIPRLDVVVDLALAIAREGRLILL